LNEFEQEKQEKNAKKVKKSEKVLGRLLGRDVFSSKMALAGTFFLRKWPSPGRFFFENGPRWDVFSLKMA